MDENLKLKKIWKKIERKFEHMPSNEFEEFNLYRRVLWKLLQRFKTVVDFIDDETKGLFFVQIFLKFKIRI